MKTLAALLLLIWAYVPARAQTLSHHSLEGAGVVAVLVADSGYDAWNHTTQVLAALGYHVQERDSTNGRIGTEAWFVPGQAQCLTSVEVLVLGHTVLLSGTCYCPLLRYRPRPVQYSATAQVPFMNFDCCAWGWAELNTVARALGGAKIVWLPSPPRKPEQSPFHINGE